MKPKVIKTSHQVAEAAHREAWFALTPQERHAWHYQMLERIYGDRLHAPMPKEALVVKIKRG